MQTAQYKTDSNLDQSMVQFPGPIELTLTKFCVK